MTPDQRRLEFFCLVHEEICYATRAQPRIVCDQGHVLSDDFQQDKWEYCSGCECFFAWDQHEPARGKCPRCGRQFAARYLCQQCSTLCTETAMPSQHSLSFVSGAPQACPSCLTKPAAMLTEHQCRQLRATFCTARAECPLCAEMIIPKTRFEFRSESYLKKPLREYIRGINGQAIRASLASTQPPLLTENSNGAFWLTKHSAENFFTVFPTVERMSDPQDFVSLQPLFNGHNPEAGELWIAAPAVAYFNQARRCWVMTQKGELHVRSEAPIGLPLREIVLPPTKPAPLPLPVFEQPLPVGKPVGGPKMERQVETELVPPSKPLAPDSGSNKKWALPAFAALIIGLLIIGYYLLFASPKRQIISKVKQGQIVTPAGSSAYDIFLSNNLSETDRAEIRREVVPILESNGNEVIRRLVSDGYSPSVSDCDNTAKIYVWLDALSPQNSYKARKFYFQGRSAFDRRDLSGAENEFRQALNLEPTWALLVNHLGRVFVQRRDYLSAQGWYQKAADLDSGWIVPKINLCVMAVENLRNYPLGEQACRAVLQLDPNKASGHYFLGRSLEEQHRNCDALREFRTAIEKASGTTSPGFNVNTLSQRLSRLVNQCGE